MTNKYVPPPVQEFKTTRGFVDISIKYVIDADMIILEEVRMGRVIFSGKDLNRIPLNVQEGFIDEIRDDLKRKDADNVGYHEQ